MLLYMICDLDDDVNALLAVTIQGAVISAENAVNCLVALVKNVYQKTITYDELIPCFTRANRGCELLADIYV
jgi:hypothetical protein